MRRFVVFTAAALFASSALAEKIVSPTGSTPKSALNYDDGSGNAVPVKDATPLPVRFPTTPTFNLGGTLPAFGSIPTFNVGTIPSLTIGSSALPTGAATGAKQDALLAALGSPLQANGTVYSQTPVASSTALTGTITSSGATPTGGTCTFASGTASCGPFQPSQTAAIRLTLSGSATFTSYLATTTGSDCSAPVPLTAGGQPINYSSTTNEYVDVPPTTGAFKYCLISAVSSGTLTYGVRQ